MKRYGLIGLVLFVIVVLASHKSDVQARPLGQTVTTTCKTGTLPFFTTVSIMSNYDLTNCGVPVGVSATVKIKLSFGGMAPTWIDFDDDIYTAAISNNFGNTWSTGVETTRIITDGNIASLKAYTAYSGSYNVTVTYLPIGNLPDTPTATATSTPTSTPTATGTATSTPTATGTATNTPTPTATPFGQTTCLSGSYDGFQFNYIIATNLDLNISCGVPVGETVQVTVILSNANQTFITIDDTMGTSMGVWDYVSGANSSYSETIADGLIKEIRIRNTGFTSYQVKITRNLPTPTPTPTPMPDSSYVCVGNSFVQPWGDVSVPREFPSCVVPPGWSISIKGDILYAGLLPTGIMMVSTTGSNSMSWLYGGGAPNPYETVNLSWTNNCCLDSRLVMNVTFKNLVVTIYPPSTATPTPTATFTPTPTPTPAVMFIPSEGYNYTYSLEPQPGLYPVIVDEYWTAYLIPNWFWPLVSTLAVTTTEGYFVPDISCNTIGAGYLCQQIEGDTTLAPTRLVDLCPSAVLTSTQSYVLSLEPACNGSQYTNAWLTNWAENRSEKCSSGLPSCQLQVGWFDEVSYAVDLHNNQPGYDVQLRVYPLEGGRDDVMVTTTAMLASTLFAVFVSRKKAETLGRGILFMVAAVAYLAVSADGGYHVLLYYFYLFFEVVFSAVDFARYRLFATGKSS